MNNIKIVVCLDGDGHFHVTPLNEREKTYKSIEQICDGDHLANSFDKLPDNFETTYLTMSNHDWEKSIEQLVQRGMLEIKTL